MNKKKIIKNIKEASKSCIGEYNLFGLTGVLFLFMSFFIMMLGFASAVETYGDFNSTFVNFTWQPAVVNNSFAISAWINVNSNTANYSIYSTNGFIASINSGKLGIQLSNS